MGLATIIALLGVAGLMGFIRLSTPDPARWHVRPAFVVPSNAGWNTWVLYPPGPTLSVLPMPGGAYASVQFPDPSGEDLLAKLDAIALATPRTTRLAGSPTSGMITWQTRSAIWGFPDFTTAEVQPIAPGQMLFLTARQGFGSGDWGVNARRLQDWLAKLSP